MIARIANLVWKELIHFSRDRVLTPMLLFGPLMELILIGIITSGDIDHLPTVVVNRDPGKRGQALVRMIELSPVFDLDQNLTDEAQARILLANSEITAAFIIPEDFSKALRDPNRARSTEVKLLLDDVDSIAANAARYGAEDIVDRFSAQVTMDWLDETGMLHAALRESSTAFEGPVIRVLYNEDLKKSFYELPAEMGIMLYFVAAGVASLGIARERERGTWEQLLVTPMRPLEIVIGKALPAIPIAYTVFLMMLTVSLVGFGLPMRGSWLLLLGVVFIYIFVELNVGVLMSAVSRTQTQAFLLVAALMMIEFIFSGYIFAVDNMPEAIQVLSNFVPMKHGMNLERSILLRGVGLEALWPSILMLVALGGGVVTVATLVLRRTLD